MTGNDMQTTAPNSHLSALPTPTPSQFVLVTPRTRLYDHRRPELGGVTPDQFVKQLAKAVEEDL